uniref:DUF86 domain-containing protein n=1 Tax=candidate division CPR3 bacterium TaxID=2268181 RepID=A0A7C4R4H6_UNCC3
MGFLKLFRQFKKLIAPYPTKSYGRNLNLQEKEEIRRKWTEIEGLIKLGRPSNFKTAVFEADKLLDHALKLLGYRGQTMGDRMKSISRSDFEKSFFDDMWQAHKVRNEMVHNINYEVMDFEAKRVIEKFKRVLRELGVL